MSNVKHLEKLTSRYIINLRLIASSNIHVGYIQEGILKRMVRLYVNKELIPIIPAESLKGSLRKLVAKFAKSINYGDELVNRIVDFHNEDVHYKEEKGKKYYPMESLSDEIQSRIVKEGIFTEEQLKELSDESVKELYYSLQCPVCRLFGSRSLAGKMNVSDFIPEKFPEILTYTSTSIDRKYGIAAEGKLFTIESIGAKTIFKGEIIIDNVMRKSHEASVLSSLINNIIELGGFYVGGAKSRGYGLLSIDENSKVQVNEFTEAKTLQDIKLNIEKLLFKKYEEMNIKEFAKWLIAD